METHTVMKKKVVIVAAPFGYGPAAKAILCLEALSDVAEITIVSKGNAFEFIRKYAAPEVVCLAGNFRTVFEQYQLASHDYFICIGNEPAVIHLISAGFQARVIFLDYLLPWRAQHETKAWQNPIRGYLVEDFPGSVDYLSGCHAARVELIAPIVNKPAADGQTDRQGKVTLSLGGLTSPLVTWQSIKPVIRQIIAGVTQLATRHNREVTIIGSAYASEIVHQDRLQVNVLSDATHDVVMNTIRGSELIILTPGLGTIHEAIACHTPMVLLPPMNSTQIFQCEVLLKYGFRMTLSPDAVSVMLDILNITDWQHQTAACLHWLKDNRTDLLAGLPGLLNTMFDAAQPLRNQILDSQSGFANSLSKKDGMKVLSEMIAG